MQVISNELYEKLNQLAQQDPELKKMLFESSKRTRNYDAFLKNGLREIEIELYQKVENHLKGLSEEELNDKELIKNSDEIESLVGEVIPTDNKSLGELMLDLNSTSLIVEGSSEGEDLYRAIEVALYQYLKEFARKQIDGYEKVDF